MKEAAESPVPRDLYLEALEKHIKEVYQWTPLPQLSYLHITALLLFKIVLWVDRLRLKTQMLNLNEDGYWISPADLSWSPLRKFIVLYHQKSYSAWKTMIERVRESISKNIISNRVFDCFIYIPILFIEGRTVLTRMYKQNKEEVDQAVMTRLQNQGKLQKTQDHETL